MAALIALEREVRAGVATISTAEYEHWGDYDGPAEEDEDPHHSGLNKAARHDAAVKATQEAISFHAAHHDDPLPVVERRKRVTLRGALLLRLLSLRRFVGRARSMTRVAPDGAEFGHISPTKGA